jgi:hypothetical protein
MVFLTAPDAVRSGIPVPDLYYSPAYGRSAELIDGGAWECAFDPETEIVHPYLRREIPGSGGHYDIVTPYGYAGPAGPPMLPPQKMARFREVFLARSLERGLVAEFIRSNPLLCDEAKVRAWAVDRLRRRTTYAIEVAADPNGYFASTCSAHRGAVRKAIRLGVTVETASARAVVDRSSEFRRIYDHTMQRVEAPARLRLSDEYFSRLVDGLGENVVVLEARSDRHACSAAMFLRCGGRLHYHLSGSTAVGRQSGAANLILDVAVRRLLPAWGVLHLGGGVAEGDGLAHFKRSLANRAYSMFLCSTIVDPLRYRELVQRAGKTADAEYFPAYRVT